MTKTMRETTSVIALGSATEERDAVKPPSRRFRAALRTSVCWPGLKRSRISWRTRPPTCAASATSGMRTGARRWGKARSPVAFHGGRVDIDGRGFGRRMASRNWSFPALPRASARTGGPWAMNQMLINSRPGGSGARFACPMAMSPRPRATAPRSRRSSSWRCRARN